MRPLAILLVRVLAAGLLSACGPCWGATAAGREGRVVPDFTRGDPIPGGARHDWNLGATGARGWMYCDQMVTTDARQVSITRVEKGSPADGILAVGDVLLGAGGKPFAYDPRTELGKALSAAESDAGGGKLALTRWRAGKTEEVVLKLPVLGSYSDTAPFDCVKSKRILEQGCRALAAQMEQRAYAKMHDPIPRSLNALALLAGGDLAYLALVKREAEWAASYTSRSMQTWHYGYVMMLVSEYVLWECVNTFSKPKDRASAHALIDHVTSDSNCGLIDASPEIFAAGLQLHRTRSDKEWSLTDCISVYRMRERGVTRALADDVHF